MEQLELVAELKKEIGPLRIIINMHCEDHIYWLDVDGSHTYPVHQYWLEKWGKTFSDFVLMCIRRRVGKTFSGSDVVKITDTHVKIRLGSVLDFVKDA